MSQSDCKDIELRDVPSTTMSQSDTGDTNLQDVSVKEKGNRDQEEYPRMQNRILVMIALYLSILLVTLVRVECIRAQDEFAYDRYRIRILSRRQFLESRTSFTPWMILDGMEVDI